MPVLQLLYAINFVGKMNVYALILTYRYVDAVLCPLLDLNLKATNFKMTLKF